MQLSQLFPLPECDHIEIKNLVLDTRILTKGDVFVAIQGRHLDGRQFIPQAIEKGAVAILLDALSPQQDLTLSWQDHCPLILVWQLEQKLSKLAGIYYDNPSQKLTLVGVTGTNGKTTVSQLLAQWVSLLGQKSAVMGTIGNGLLGEIQPSVNTTGSALAVQKNLAQFVEQEATFCAMEVSSHGLAQYRVEDLSFDVAIFTNLTHDHLDYHKTMEKYAQAKFRFFGELNTHTQVLNVDDEVGATWYSQLPNSIAVSIKPDTLFYQSRSRKWIQAKQVLYSPQGAEIHIESTWGKGILHSVLLGEFNVSNLLLALATLLELGYSFTNLLNTASQLVGACGRMELFHQQGKPTFVVDYAHTPDALEKALMALYAHCTGDIWCVFGCGGDRDKGKRPLMGQIAQKYAQHSVITNDNPRTENPQAIVNDILAGVVANQSTMVMLDRKKAIEYCMQHAKPQDVVLVAGKGHEDYQIIGTQKISFSDRTLIQHLLSQ